jgi:hypothetical protein
MSSSCDSQGWMPATGWYGDEYVKWIDVGNNTYVAVSIN